MNCDIVLREGERLDEVNESLKLIQKTDGLTFGTDAYLLAAYMYANASGFAAELGGGTGIISLLAASRKRFEKITVAEIQEDYAELIGRNIELNDMSDRAIGTKMSAERHICVSHSDPLKAIVTLLLGCPVKKGKVHKAVYDRPVIIGVIFGTPRVPSSDKACITENKARGKG
jgi:hypothetical protein